MVLIPGNVPNRLRAAGRGGASVCPIWAMWSRRYDLRPVGNLAATEKPADTALHRAPDAHELELTVVLPCLNEAETVARCVTKAGDVAARRRRVG